MNDIYLGFEIEKQADGYWVKDRGVYKFVAHPTLSAAKRRIVRHVRLLMIEEGLYAA